MLQRFSLVVASAALVALLVAGCGGSPSPQETWANSVCEPLVQWKDQISAIGDDVNSELKSPSAETRANLTASVTKGQQATTTLVADLKDVVDGLTKSLQQSSAIVKTQVDALQSSASISQAITSLGEIAAQISGAVAQTQGAVDSLDAVASDLKDGFDKASSCKKLRGS